MKFGWRSIRYLLGKRAGGYREFDSQQWTFLAAKIATTACVVYLWFHTPKPGVAVAILATVAAVVSVHSEMRPWQKSVWIVLIILLLQIERRAIILDRKLVDRETSDRNALFEALLSDQRHIMLRIADSQQVRFDETMSRLQSATADVQKIGITAGKSLNVAEDALGEITGGDSVPCVIVNRFGPGSSISFSLKNSGKYPLTNIDFSLLYPSYGFGTATTHMVFDHLDPYERKPLGESAHVKSGDSSSFDFALKTRSGTYYEALRVPEDAVTSDATERPSNRKQHPQHPKDRQRAMDARVEVGGYWEPKTFIDDLQVDGAVSYEPPPENLKPWLQCARTQREYEDRQWELHRQFVKDLSLRKPAGRRMHNH